MFGQKYLSKFVVIFNDGNIYSSPEGAIFYVEDGFGQNPLGPVLDIQDTGHL